MQFQFIELHVQHAISETRLHVRSSNCMFICELHVEHAVRCTIQRMMINSNNKMHVERVWCFRICTSHNNLHVEHVILFLSDMHIEVSYMHFRHADTRYWMHVGHYNVPSKIDTNMGMVFLFDVLNMSIWYTGALPTWIYLCHSVRRHVFCGAGHAWSQLFERVLCLLDQCLQTCCNRAEGRADRALQCGVARRQAQHAQATLNKRLKCCEKGVDSPVT